MIIKFFPSGRHDVKSAINYLVGSKYSRKQAVVLKGDCELTRKIVKDNPYKEKYVSGVLSFSEPAIDYRTLVSIINDFEYFFLPGYLPSEYCSLWIKHQDKQRTELHFIFPTINIMEGSRIYLCNPYKEFGSIYFWQKYINEKYELDNPNDPINFSLLSFSGKLPASVRSEAAEITRLASKKFWNEEIENAQDLFDFLKKNKFEVKSIHEHHIVVVGKSNISFRLNCKLLKDDISYAAVRESLINDSFEYNELYPSRADDICERIRFFIKRKEKKKKSLLMDCFIAFEGRNSSFFIAENRAVLLNFKNEPKEVGLRHGDELIYTEFNRLIRVANESIQQAVSRYDQSREELKHAVERTQPKNPDAGRAAFSSDENLRAVRHKFERFREHVECQLGFVVEQIERVKGLGSEDSYDFS